MRFQVADANGTPLQRVPLGSVVTVTLQLTTADDIGGVVEVEAAMPAGLEPIDPNVASDASSAGE